MKKNSFFSFASFSTYLVGTIFAGFEKSNIDFTSLVLGILVFLTVLALQLLFNYLSTSKINPYSRVSFERGNKKSQLFILTHGGIFGYDLSTQALVAKLSADGSADGQIYMWPNRRC